MPQPVANPFNLTADEIQRLLAPGAPSLPELDAARRDLGALYHAPQTQMMLEQTQSFSETIEQIPALPYTHYRLFRRTGDRQQFEAPYFLRRSRLAAAALRLFLGQADLKDIVQDYVWAICEETNWVLPAHENDLIDLFSAETSFMLAELLAFLGDTLDAEVRARVRTEVERRVFDPYLRFYHLCWWYKSGLNWNGVCNSSVAAAFVLLEPEPGRLARALELALAGLRVYLDTAFEEDGSSNEGVGYWHYGLINFVALAEMLRARTEGAIDLLAAERMRRIAAFPAKLWLSGANFAPFSDCEEILHLDPGVIARLAARTGESALADLLTPSLVSGRDRGLPMMLRNILWWDGRYRQPVPAGDVYLEQGNIVRLTAHTPAGSPVIVMIKAGHNDENHNQNDVGSFMLHVGDETLLTDPGRGLYTRQYFGPERYENIFANSYGHSVPRVGDQLQRAGREFYGRFLNIETNGPTKQAQLEFARAYPLPNLISARRQITITKLGMVWLEDAFSFSENPLEVEEAFVTWFEVDARGATVVIHGQHHQLQLTLEAPAESRFEVEHLTEQCRANAKPGVLKRIRVALPVAGETQIRVRMEV